MAENVIFSISTEMEMEGRQLKAVHPNKDGVFTGIPLTVIGCNSRNNVNYERESVLKCLTDENSRFAANIKTGDMEGNGVILFSTVTRTLVVFSTSIEHACHITSRESMVKKPMV